MTMQLSGQNKQGTRSLDAADFLRLGVSPACFPLSVQNDAKEGGGCGIASNYGYAAFIATLLYSKEYEERYGHGLPAGGQPITDALKFAESSWPYSWAALRLA